jgi:hypothetical protein
MFWCMYLHFWMLNNTRSDLDGITYFLLGMVVRGSFGGKFSIYGWSFAHGAITASQWDQPPARESGRELWPSTNNGKLPRPVYPLGVFCVVLACYGGRVVYPTVPIPTCISLDRVSARKKWIRQFHLFTNSFIHYAAPDRGCSLDWVHCDYSASSSFLHTARFLTHSTLVKQLTQ